MQGPPINIINIVYIFNVYIRSTDWTLKFKHLLMSKTDMLRILAIFFNISFSWRLEN